MLVLKNIKKDYYVGDQTVPALKGVDISFRKNEFVSVLGASGCGKTTLLNIIGGLDRYTSGDLIINGRSTKSYKDSDWDTYRNHSIGFVFQSYNLIPHQTVLTNVELALTISGVSKNERRKRAVAALNKVGLGDQLNKKPNQMSGGQMQRVAIARAIVNDPEILLADEPTGALDTATSLQIMEILKEIASDRLVIMVTHNPELAQNYSTRIIRLQDGTVTDDSSPYSEEEAKANVKKDAKKKKPLSIRTALSLSLNNLLTKKARTFLTSFAGSIGIIGIALILSLSSGINAYIADVQEDALSSYPITLEQETQDYSALFSAMIDAKEESNRVVEDGKIYVDDSMAKMLSAMMSTTKNDLTAFKAYLEAHKDELGEALSDVRYTYNFNLQVYSEDGNTRVNPTTILDHMGAMTDMMNMVAGNNSYAASNYGTSLSLFREMLDNTTLLQSQYDVISGTWANDPHEVMLVVGENNTITNMVLYALGLADQTELEELFPKILAGEKLELNYPTYTYEDFVGMTFYVVPNNDFFVKSDKTYEKNGVSYPVWEDVRLQKDFDQVAFAKEHGIPLKISAIVRKNPDAASASMQEGTIAYSSALAKEMMELVQASEIAKQQTEQTPDIDVLSGLPYNKGQFATMTDGEKLIYFENFLSKADAQFKADIQSALLSADLSASVTAQATAEINDKPESELAHYTASLFFKLATESPEQLKPILIGLMELSMPKEQFDQLKPMLDSLNVNDILGMMAQSSPEGFGEEQMEQALKEATAEEILPLAIALRSAELMQAGLDAYSVKQLAEMFDNTYPTLSAEQKLALFSKYEKKLLSATDYDRQIINIGFVDFDSPATISLYSKDFKSKDKITDFIAKYNEGKEEDDRIVYTDLVGLMMSSVTTIINAISYVLIAFVSISLVVSSIMIGIITYISVLERTKEIGILRAIGASKHDISRVFNAETLIVGFCAGAIGILATILLCIPINAIIHFVSGIDAINAALPVVGGIVLVAISMFLTFIAGLIPSKLAAKKDPVLALRTE